MIIVNADDFGYSPSVNEAINECFLQKIISSTTIMMNMPFAESGVDLARSNGYSEKIGLHFNIIEGKPLSYTIKKCRRLCDSEGNFIYKRNSVWHWKNVEKEAIREEFQAQLNALLKLGITPTHVDSHQHVHTELPVYLILKKCLKSNKIPALRISRNLGVRSRNLPYKYIVNSFMKWDGFHVTDLMQEYGAFNVDNIDKKVELMCHPILKEGRIVDSVVGTIIQRKFDNLISYRDL